MSFMGLKGVGCVSLWARRWGSAMEGGGSAEAVVAPRAVSCRGGGGRYL